MIDRVELSCGYSVVVENDTEKQKTIMGIANWQLIFAKKQDVVDHIKLLERALEFWEFEESPTP